jgi:hypothetical protein
MATLRKSIEDKLITDMTALKHDNNTDVCFAVTQALFVDFPTSLPACQVLPMSPSVEVSGLGYDSRVLGFDILVYELIETNTDYTEAKRKLDRLMDIEDRILNYLEKIPNNIEYVNGSHLYRLQVQPSSYSYESSENGLRVYLSIQLNCYVNIDVKSI